MSKHINKKSIDCQVTPCQDGEEQSLPKVVLLGRTNVGKSTLFNKLTEKYHAMVSSLTGTTRDIKRAHLEWQGNKFELIDTGGLTTKHLVRGKSGLKSPSTREPSDINKQIAEKALNAVKEATFIIFVVDVRDGLMKEDKEIAEWIKKYPLILSWRQPRIPHFNKDGRIIVAVNKVDGVNLRSESAVFYKLGLGDPVLISATTGAGTGDLLDLIVKFLPIYKRTLAVPCGADSKRGSQTMNKLPPAKGRKVKVSIIGRPNVGKSSLLNAILGEERVIVSSIPHTTREPIDTELEYKDYTIRLVDTAGIRRKARIKLKSLEKQGVALSLKSLKLSDVALLVIDATERVGKQDLKLVDEAVKARIGLIIVINKIDLLENLKQTDHLNLIKAVQNTFNNAKWAPVMLLSAKTGKNVKRVLDQIVSVYHTRSSTADQNALTALAEKLRQKQAPPKQRHAKLRPRIINIEQTETSPPHFEIIYKGKGILPMTYLKFLEKGIRHEFDFTGTPIIIHQKKI